MATKKAYELAVELGDELRKRMASTFTVITDGIDANGDSTLSLTADSTPATTEKNLFIRVKPVSWPLAKDVLGLTAQIYTPHVIEVAVEANPAGGAGADIFTPLEMLTILATVAKRGTRVDLYVSAAGTIPSVTVVNTAGSLVGSYLPELYWGILAQQ